MWRKFGSGKQEHLVLFAFDCLGESKTDKNNLRAAFPQYLLAGDGGFSVKTSLIGARGLYYRERARHRVAPHPIRFFAQASRGDRTNGRASRGLRPDVERHRDGVRSRVDAWLEGIGPAHPIVHASGQPYADNGGEVPVAVRRPVVES